MGMYDNVKVDFECPGCGYFDEEHIWQTKALDRILDTYEVGDEIEIRNLKIHEGTIEIHEVCPECKSFVKGWIRIEEGILTDKVFDVKVKG